MMHTKNKSNDIVRAFAQAHDIPSLALSEAGTAGVRLKEGAELYLERATEQGQLFIYTILGTLPSQPEERLAYMEHMLSLNCLEQGTLCGTLAVDGLTDAVLLQAGIAEADLSVARLEQAAQELLLHRPRLMDNLRRFEGGRATSKNATARQLNYYQAVGGAQ